MLQFCDFLMINKFLKCKLKKLCLFLSLDEKYRPSSQGLHIKSVQPTDAGIYHCRAEIKDYGRLSELSVTLDVRGVFFLTIPRCCIVNFIVQPTTIFDNLYLILLV